MGGEAQREKQDQGAPWYLTVGPGGPRAERVLGVPTGHVLGRGLLQLSVPGPLHTVRRHQHPLIPQRVVAGVLVLCGMAAGSLRGHEWGSFLRDMTGGTRVGWRCEWVDTSKGHDWGNTVGRTEWGSVSGVGNEYGTTVRRLR